VIASGPPHPQGKRSYDDDATPSDDRNSRQRGGGRLGRRACAGAQAARAALDGATPLAKNAYKLPLFETLIRRAILQAVAQR